MIRYLFAAASLFAAACVIAGDVTIPAKLQTEPGRLVKIEAESKGAVIRWLNPDPGNLDVIPSESGRWVIVSSPRPGVYRLACWTAIDGVPTEASICVLTVGTPEPPRPPTPPAPPVDALTAEIQRIYDAEAEPAELKRQVKERLAALYRVAAQATADPQLLTTGMLASAISRNAAGVGDGLHNLRKSLGGKTLDLLGPEPAAELTAARRQAASELFTKFAKSLEAVK